MNTAIDVTDVLLHFTAPCCVCFVMDIIPQFEAFVH